MLNFFGKGSAFADDNTCAYFTDNREMIIIDFSQSAFPKFKRLNFKDIDTIYILVTHTHGDHISGIGTLIHYAIYHLNSPVVVVTPNDEVKEIMSTLLNKIEGCNADGYSIIPAQQLSKKWFLMSIPTEHTKTHEGKCCGYSFYTKDSLVVYTGDTNIIEPFINFINNCDISKKYLYTEISASESGVHLFIDDNMNSLLELEHQGVEVYLMHLDDEDVIREKIKDTGLKIVETI